MKDTESKNKVDDARDILRKIPPVGELLEKALTMGLIAEYGRPRVKKVTVSAVESFRKAVLAGDSGVDDSRSAEQKILQQVREKLQSLASDNICAAINAAGIVLHTALGRSVWPQSVVDSVARDLHGYVTLATDRLTGKRSERDNRLEDILKEVTGAQAAAVVNNNAGATLLVLAALASGREAIISRGQLIEIGGAFRLPDVMAAAGTAMVEIGTTNRTHKRDFVKAINDNTALLFRAHPSNFRVSGFTGEVTTAELVQIARQANADRENSLADIAVVDDLGAGSLVDLENFNLPHEPTVQESLAAGADICLFSGDKLIGASQAGIIVGRADLIAKIRSHPLHRALRADKTCLMALERTLQLFAHGDIEMLTKEHPLYAMLALGLDELSERADKLASLILKLTGTDLHCEVVDVEDYPGGGAMPTEAMAGKAVLMRSSAISPHKLAEAMRMDEACVFPRVTENAVVLHVRTIFPHQLETVAQCVGRVIAEAART